MLTQEANDMLTRVGPGTPAGELLRRYWQPVCYVPDLDVHPTKAVRMLGEDLVVYRDSSGAYGVVGKHCLHRGASLEYGFVEDGCTLRCAYHGWKYDASGHVVEQPFEPHGSRFKDKLRQTAYPAQELGGIVFAYLGPEPRPLLPRWDVLVREDGTRSLERRPDLRCNWLQVQENSADVTHTYFLHGHTLHTRGVEHPGLDTYYRPIRRYGFRRFRWGLLKQFTIERNGKEITAEVGNPLIFPNMLRLREGVRCEAMHWRVPIDDTNTRLFYSSFEPADGDAVPNSDPPQVIDRQEWQAPDGRYQMDGDFYVQDMMAWETPGPIFDRCAEHLGASDHGIVLYRQMLREAIEDVTQGRDPLALLRDEADNEVIDVTTVAAEALADGEPMREFEVTPLAQDTTQPGVGRS